MADSWVTIALNDKECWEAFILAESLQYVLSIKRRTILIGSQVTNQLRQLLVYFFHLIQPLPLSDLENARTIVEIAQNLKPWNKTIFIPVSTIILENCDQLFQTEDHWEKLSSETTSSAHFIRTNHGRKASISFEFNARNSKASKSFYATPHSNTGSKSLYFDCQSDVFRNRVVPKITGNKEAWIPALLKSNPLFPNFDSGPNVIPNEDDDLREAIAIIGMGCRFAGANTTEEFWKLLCSESFTVRRFPEERPTLNVGGIEETVAGWLSCPIFGFDSEFFGISAKEIMIMDPQHRLLLEVVWEGLEDAGIPLDTLQGSKSGVVVGNLLQDYDRIIPSCSELGITETERRRGNGLVSLSGRISQFLGLNGLSVSHEAGCSSGLGALHLGCESLLRKETDLVITGGANMVLLPRAYNTAVLSSEFKCKTFDETADGFVSGEAIGIVILKRYADAVRDGDRIHALIRGTGMSNDGASLCYGTPNPYAHAHTHRLALKKSGISPAEVQYVETHGTGTQKGDVGEIFGLTDAYGGVRRKSPLVIGSVKPNIGHGEAGAALGSLIKVILALKNEEIPANILLNQINTKIDLNKIPAVIPTKRTPWIGKRRLAGISSFSLTGSLVHAILQSAPQRRMNGSLNSETCPQVITISAVNEEALEAQRLNYLQHFKSNSHLALSDIAFATNFCRTHFKCRIAVTAQSTQDLIEKLELGIYRKSSCNAQAPSFPPIAFNFPKEIGVEQILTEKNNLCELFPIFRASLQETEEMYIKITGKNLWSENSNLELQIFAIQIGLVDLWQSFGIVPRYVESDGFGHLAGAVCWKVLTKADVLHLCEEAKERDKLYLQSICLKSPQFQFYTLSSIWNEAEESQRTFQIDQFLTPRTRKTEGIFEILAEIYVQGGHLDWTTWFGKRSKQVNLPLYPFQRQQFLLDFEKLTN